MRCFLSFFRNVCGIIVFTFLGGLGFGLIVLASIFLYLSYYSEVGIDFLRQAVDDFGPSFIYSPLLLSIVLMFAGVLCILRGERILRRNQ